jgi:nitrogen fixation/metabolism regulation signal transduction histidine kinase
LHDVVGLEDFANGVAHQFKAFLGDRSSHGLDHWQHAFELAYHAGPAVAAQAFDPQGPSGMPTISLIARGAQLPEARRLLVFDDISEIVSAQRAQAWGEVARRVAHEIKNPLTPIQLSAERIEMKLHDKLEPADSADQISQNYCGPSRCDEATGQ